MDIWKAQVESMKEEYDTLIREKEEREKEVLEANSKIITFDQPWGVAEDEEDWADDMGGI